MKVQYLVVNGILSKPSSIDSWTDVFEDEYQNRGYPCTRYEYFSGALTRWMFQGQRVKDLYKICCRSKMPLVYVGHSNGCELFSRLVKEHDVQFEAAHLFSAAVDSDFRKNGFNSVLFSGRVKKLHLYCSKGDRVLRDLASKTEWLNRFGLGYGKLGYTGPRYLSKTLQKHVSVINHDSFDHSDWFKGDQIIKSLEMTLK